MVYPTIIVDNFFRHPDIVLDLASKTSYKKDLEGHFPGERSDHLHINNFNFFNYVNSKILSTIYPTCFKEINYTAKTFFQKISGKRYPHEGWIHKDSDEITAIVYLSKHKNCGTSLWKRKDFGGNKLVGHKKEDFNKKDLFDKESLFYLKQSNDMFEKTLTIDSYLNRLVLFDSNNWHSAENLLDKNNEEDRLTLISFIDNINKENSALKYSINESLKLD